MNSKTCSVIVPIYNAAPFLAQCLSSIKMQTYQDLQVILVDDGSTDESAEIAKSFVDADIRFMLYQQANQGQGVARNRGLEIAIGKYIVFVDADDFLDNDYIQIHIDELGAEDYIQSGYRRVDTNGAVLAQKSPFHRYQFTSPCMRLYRLEWLKSQKLSFPQAMIYEDVIFSLQIWGLIPKVKILNYYGYNYTLNPSSTTSTINHTAQQTLTKKILSLPVPVWLKLYTIFRLFIFFHKS